MSLAVNEAVERAHRHGILSTTSLMVAGAAADDAVARAKRMPALRVGLHLVVIEGRAVLPPQTIPQLVGPDGQFPSDQVVLGVRYFFDPRARRQLRREIAAQYAAFKATGLRLDHANAHKHMHLHPSVGRFLIEEGRAYGLPAIRVPNEPPAIMARLGSPPGLGGRALYWFTGNLRVQAKRAGLHTNDYVFGIGWTGHMTIGRLLRLAPQLPEGLGELYFHPAIEQATGAGTGSANDYEHLGELEALMSCAVADALPRRVGYNSEEPTDDRT